MISTLRRFNKTGTEYTDFIFDLPEGSQGNTEADWRQWRQTRFGHARGERSRPQFQVTAHNSVRPSVRKRTEVARKLRDQTRKPYMPGRIGEASPRHLYGGEQPEVGFECPAQCTALFIGNPGVGKSTFLNTLVGEPAFTLGSGRASRSARD